MTVHPVALVVGVLVLAVLFLAVGTLRGSFRFWLVGYVLAATALVLAYGGLRATRSARGPAPQAASAGARAGGARPAPPAAPAQVRP